MGMLWPPAWQSGAHCAVCEAITFEGSTPVFVYAQTVGLNRCPGLDPLFPDPNRVIRMIQSPVNPCQWFGHYIEGLYTLGWTYTLTGVSSFMFIGEAGGALIFNDIINIICRSIFVNDLVCGAPMFPAFSGGSVHCFWGL